MVDKIEQNLIGVFETGTRYFNSKTERWPLLSKRMDSLFVSVDINNDGSKILVGVFETGTLY